MAEIGQRLGKAFEKSDVKVRAPSAHAMHTLLLPPILALPPGVKHARHSHRSTHRKGQPGAVSLQDVGVWLILSLDSWQICTPFLRSSSRACVDGIGLI